MPLIDSHQHFWTVDKGWYSWMSPAIGPALYRDYGPEDLEPLAEAAGVSGTILVQAAQSIQETFHLLEVARSSSLVKGVVGWVDLAGTNAVDEIDGLAADPLVKGLRPMVQDIADPVWMLLPELRPALRRMEELNWVFDALVRPAQWDSLLRFLGKYPRLRVVLDHAGKPEIKAGRDGYERWAAWIAQVASFPNARCKLSGLLSEAEPGAGPEVLKPYVDWMIRCFGPYRLMWGSDWPVLNAVSGYSEWLGMARTLTARLSAAEQREIFSGVARRVYRL